MIDFSKFEKINDEAYIWRGFLDSESCDIAFQESSEQDPNTVNLRDSDKIELLSVFVNDKIRNAVNLFFENTEYKLDNFLHWYTAPGLWFNIHRDDEAYDPNPNKKVWAGVIYLSNMDGGTLFYPTNNTLVQPLKGDMVIHTSAIPHGATPVKGENKRTITYVVYDKNKLVDENDPETDLKYLSDLREFQVLESKEWLKSDMGVYWEKMQNVNWETYISPDNQFLPKRA